MVVVSMPPTWLVHVPYGRNDREAQHWECEAVTGLPSRTGRQHNTLYVTGGSTGGNSDGRYVRQSLQLLTVTSPVCVHMREVGYICVAVRVINAMDQRFTKATSCALLFTTNALVFTSNALFFCFNNTSLFSSISIATRWKSQLTRWKVSRWL